ncbi:DUF2569 domain-containing protein [Paenibacillus sp. IB182496]|uniref:DUF2569 domain-containing protein n=1 Tax=Paenibacillus sabuli TaxID=2772509 RepID=A0A927BN43_9BACL|nr:DUF2569 domain-containing protein [Paenibacillus sabuli]MBD2843583.1 DUF2569 domain-containing protein [Paenibacillus sabuli]
MQSNIQQKNMETQYGVSGLGGWLVLVQIGLYGSLVLAAIQFFFYLLPSFESETWDLLTSKDSEIYHVLWGPMLAFETVYHVVLIGFCTYILFQFYARKSSVPKLMILFYTLSLVACGLDYLFIQLIPIAKELDDGSTLRDGIRSLLTCAIWVPYFLKSERVENTFIR